MRPLSKMKDLDCELTLTISNPSTFKYFTFDFDSKTQNYLGYEYLMDRFYINALQMENYKSIHIIKTACFNKILLQF